MPSMGDETWKGGLGQGRGEVRVLCLLSCGEQILFCTVSHVGEAPGLHLPLAWRKTGQGSSWRGGWGGAD